MSIIVAPIKTIEELTLEMLPFQKVLSAEKKLDIRLTAWFGGKASQGFHKSSPLGIDLDQRLGTLVYPIE